MAARKRKAKPIEATDPTTKPDAWRDCIDGERSDTCHDKPEPKVEVTGLDLNRYALDHILPGAAEMCEEGQRREIIAERDGVKEASKVVWFVETRPGHFATTGRLMLGMPPLKWTGRASEAHWQYCLHLQRFRIARGEDARKIARTTTFMQAGKGAQG